MTHQPHPPTEPSGRTRRGLPPLAASVVWVVAGGCWVGQLVVPWTSSGLLSRSSLADALALVRAGGVGEAVPAGTTAGALVLPVAGVVLVALVAVPTRLGTLARGLVAVVGAGAWVALWRVVPQDGAGLGPGGWLGAAGVGAAGLALVAELVVRRSAGRAVAVVGLVLAVVGAGAVTWQATRHRVGADSPEDAVRQLAAAVEQRDAVAALAVVAPDEVDDVVSAYLRLRGGMDTGGEPDDGPSVADAVTITVDDVELETQPDSTSGPDGVVRARVVLVGGRYEVDLDLAALPGPFGALARLFPDGAWRGDLADVADGPVGLFVDDGDGDGSGLLAASTVRVDGRWYVTGVGTAVDRVTAVVLGDDLATPDLGELPDLLLDRLGEGLADRLGERLGG
ncbi:hypothetical protein GCM10023340_07890 [Nocardioides marinquilinus]|uniref:Uncharacterized protein n=1 Tax=Nocardioides marinquilinus TaxID=1210400 RepID=A0ABP9P9T6_9ACTN